MKEAKQQYREKLDGCYSTADDRLMWQGLQQITDYKGTITEITNTTITLPKQLNKFHSSFETFSSNTQRRLMYTKP